MRAALAEDKAADKHEKALVGYDSSLQTFNDFAEAAREALEHKGLPGVFGVRGVVPDFPGSDAANARAKIDALISHIGIGRLQALKEASATGASGFGALTAPELKLLIDSVAALGKAQSVEQGKEHLEKIKAYAERGAANAARLRAAAVKRRAAKGEDAEEDVTPPEDSDAALLDKYAPKKP